MPKLAFSLVLIIAVAALSTNRAQAGTQLVDSRIDTVVVQPDRATVSRLATVRLEAGRHELRFTDLPVVAEPSSVRLELREGNLVIGRPLFREVETLLPVGPRARALTEELERLASQRRIERDAIAVQELLLDVLRQSQIVVEPGGSQPTADPGSLLGPLETRAKQALLAIRNAERATTRLDAEIDQLQRELARLGDDPMRQLSLTVPVTAERAGEATLNLVYTVRDAGFTPGLEARLDVDTGVVALTGTAAVSQRTGEDWLDVQLTLSTATPNWRIAAPPTDSWYIDVQPDMPQPGARLEAAAPMALADAADVTVDRAAFDVTYRVAEPMSVAADGAAQRVTIETVELSAELIWRTVPAIDEASYLTALLTYDGAAPLLPGPVALHRDGQLIGETAGDGLQPGEALELGFGADPAVVVERRLVTDQRARSGLIGTTRRHERRFVIEATNRRQQPVELQIIDRLPVSRDSRITVDRLPATSPPTTEAHDRDQGVLAWRRQLEPGATTTVTLAYAIGHPADLDVSGF